MDLGLSNTREASLKDGCLALRQSVLEKQRARCAPGPIYNPNISASSRKSVRDIRFGSGPARFEDVPDINKRPSSAPGTSSRVHHPGPMTYDPNAIKKAILLQSNKKNPPSIKFGSAERACNSDFSSNKMTPSPAEYDPESIRRGISFSKAGTPSFQFGRSQSSEGSRSKIQPGPSDYCPHAIRKGIMSTKSSMPSVKFGSPPRKRSDSRHSNPSAQEYDTESIRRGVNSLSTKKRPAGVRFTTGPRTYNDAEERERASKPGPCTYRTRSSIGDQVNSRYKSQPRISFGAR
ncbi:hypothetical protein ACHAXR_008737 [Thalassiosira sp. AJA248-18]